jgi:hypothetical protein
MTYWQRLKLRIARRLVRHLPDVGIAYYTRNDAWVLDFDGETLIATQDCPRPWEVTSWDIRS